MALQCDRPNKLVWALGNAETEDTTPKQFAFDDVLEQHVGQPEVFESVGLPAIQAALAGNVGCVITYGASGAGKDYSIRCERPGQEGVLYRGLSLIFTGSATLANPASSTPRPARPWQPEGDPDKPHEPPSPVRLSYLLLTRDQALHDLLAMGELDLTPAELVGTGVLRSACQWETVTSASEVLRVLSRADSARQQAQPGSHAQNGAHTIILLAVGERGMLLLASLASSDAVDLSDEHGHEGGLASSFEALGRCFDALARSKRQTPPITTSKLTALLAPALGGPGATPGGYASLLLCVHPAIGQAASTHQTLQFGQLSVPTVTRVQAQSTVDYVALAAQLMAQRDAKQEALHELELKVLKVLRPQLDDVMTSEQQIKALSIALAQTQWEARTFLSKEAQIQAKLDELRQEHSQRMYTLRAERTAIMSELQDEMGSVKGGREFGEMREQHEQDVQAIGLRLRALQSYVETAEAELAVQEENSTRARAVLPAAARELATLALGFSEGGASEEAAALFAHSLAILEAAFGSQQPELAAFKMEVQRVVDSGAATSRHQPSAAADGGADPYDA